MPTHPEAIRLAEELARKLAALNRAKQDLEYTVQSIVAKDLAPSPAGPTNPRLGVEDGTIGGNSSALSYDDYALALGAIGALVAAVTQPVAPGGPTVEQALLRFAIG